MLNPTVGDLLNIIKNNLNSKISFCNFKGNKYNLNLNQRSVVAMISGINFEIQDIDLINSDNNSSFKKYSERLFNDKYAKFYDEVIQVYTSIDNKDKEMVSEYFDQNILPNIENSSKFFQDIRNLVNNMEASLTKERLQNIDNNKTLFLKTLGYVINNREVLKQEKKKNSKKSQNIKRSKNQSYTSAVRIIIKVEEEIDEDYKTIEVYNFKETLELIFNRGYIITKVYKDNGQVIICVIQSELTLRCIDKEKYIDAIKLIEYYKEEFKPKYSWPDYSIVTLARRGLNSSKWIAYGYFSGEQLIGYIDCKETIGYGIECGIELIDKGYRNQGLAASLLYLIKLKYPYNYIYSGTYESNYAMRGTFDTTGFKCISQNYDRINLEYPENKTLYTASFYYNAKPILNQSKFNKYKKIKEV